MIFKLEMLGDDGYEYHYDFVLGKCQRLETVGWDELPYGVKEEVLRCDRQVHGKED